NWSSMDRCYLQAEAGIRYFHVTGVQTCALPISGSMPTAIPADSVGLVSPKVEHFAEPLALACGRTLDAYQLIYETYGELNAARSNAVLICHALSGHHHAAGFHGMDERKPGWWDSCIGPGKAI